jgi:hypothetical protein
MADFAFSNLEFNNPDDSIHYKVKAVEAFFFWDMGLRHWGFGSRNFETVDLFVFNYHFKLSLFI